MYQVYTVIVNTVEAYQEKHSPFLSLLHGTDVVPSVGREWMLPKRSVRRSGWDLIGNWI